MSRRDAELNSYGRELRLAQTKLKMGKLQLLDEGSPETLLGQVERLRKELQEEKSNIDLID